MNIISNEPSLGLYRIQEHIRKSIPKLENQTKKLEDCSTVMKDLNYTMENAQHSIISGTVLITAFTGGTITTADRGRRYNLHKLFEVFSKENRFKVENSNQSLNNIEHNLVELNNILSAAQM